MQFHTHIISAAATAALAPAAAAAFPLSGRRFFTP